MSKATSIEEYLNRLDPERIRPMTMLAESIRDNLPVGFMESINSGMPSWVVPHDIYGSGYHVNPELPLPFISIASQKSHIAVYHMGLYADKELMDWFVNSYPEHCNTKLNMGKSCIRFKNPKKIPYVLIALLCRKMTPQQWIKVYERGLKDH